MAHSHSKTQSHNPAQQWADLLRYDASRRDPSFQEPRNGEGSSHDHHWAHSHHAGHLEAATSTLPKPSKVKQIHLGDNLPHMPERAEEQQAVSPNTAPQPRWSGTSTLQDGKYAHLEDPYAQEDTHSLKRIVTPTALKGENGVLVDRELERLRERRPKEIRMKWRVITGTMMLFVMGFTAYMVAQYTIAYLALSPSNWFLSDSQDGTKVSPDPLLRSIAMLELIISAIALFGICASGFYLRMTRRRSCGRGLIWFTAIVSTTINVALSVANIVMIIGWHKQYANKPDDPLGRTRDVGQRCNGVWDLDILWSAARSSSIAKPESSASAVTNPECTLDSAKTLKMFLIAAGIRLVVFVVLSSLWLICLERYNRTTKTVTYSSDSVVDESPEMYKLLQEDQGATWTMSQRQQQYDMPGSYYTSKDIEKGDPELDKDDHSLPHFPEMQYSNATLVGPPPKLDRFAWQRGEASYGGAGHFAHDDDVHVYGNIGRSEDPDQTRQHPREHSAGAWSNGIMDRLWGALWSGGGSQDNHPTTQPFEAVAQDEKYHESEGQEHLHPWHAQWHARENTRLGVRGWFSGRDTSRQSDYDEDEEAQTVAEREEIQMEKTSHCHERSSSSQGRRAQEDRHAASRKVHAGVLADQANDPYTSGLGTRSLSRKAAMERAEKRKQEQQDRIAFLSSLGRPLEEEEARDNVPPLKSAGRHSSGRSQTARSSTSPSSGDRLPVMPQLLSVPVAANDVRANDPGRGKTRHGNAPDLSSDEEADDDAQFWHNAEALQNRAAAAKRRGEPVFVRQLGKLVRKLSAIESVGSGGEPSQHQSRNSREPSTASALY